MDREEQGTDESRERMDSPEHQRGESSVETGKVQAQSRFWFPFAHEVVRGRTWSRLSKIAKAVFPVIATFANFKTGENSFPSITTISKYSGVARSSVFLALEELVEVGLVEVTEKGGVTGSNRYRIVLWPVAAAGPAIGPADPAAGPGGSEDRTGGGPIGGNELVRPSNPNYTPVIINQVTTTTNTSDKNRRRSGGGNGGEKNSPETLLDTLGLRSTSGKKQLEDLITRFGLDQASAACDEAVAQGRPTLKYMAGILRNWEGKGRIVRSSRAEHREELKERERAATRRGSADKEAFRTRQAEALNMAKARLSEVPLNELSAWQRLEAAKAFGAGLSGKLADSYVETQILNRVAEKFGIEGL